MTKKINGYSIMSSVKKTLKTHFGGSRIEKMEKTSNNYIQLIENERKDIITEKKYIIKLISMEKTAALKHIREILKKIKKHPNHYSSYKGQFEDVYYTFKKNIRSIVDTANKLSSRLRIDKSRSFESDDEQNEESDEQNDSISPKSLKTRKLPIPQKSQTRKRSPSPSKSPSRERTPTPEKARTPEKTLSPSKSPSPEKTLSPSKSPSPEKSSSYTSVPPIPSSKSSSYSIPPIPSSKSSSYTSAPPISSSKSPIRMVTEKAIEEREMLNKQKQDDENKEEEEEEEEEEEDYY
jgi:hypothetical protein